MTPAPSLRTLPHPERGQLEAAIRRAVAEALAEGWRPWELRDVAYAAAASLRVRLWPRDVDALLRPS